MANGHKNYTVGFQYGAALGGFIAIRSDGIRISSDEKLNPNH
jgi:hypothetical protein